MYVRFVRSFAIFSVCLCLSCLCVPLAGAVPDVDELAEGSSDSSFYDGGFDQSDSLESFPNVAAQSDVGQNVIIENITIQMPEDNSDAEMEDTENILEDLPPDTFSDLGQLLDTYETPPHSVDYDGETWELVGGSRMMLAAPSPTSSEPTTLKDALTGLIGEYEPILFEYRYQNQNMTTYSYLREVQIDYPWICAAAMLALILYCLFRLGGAIICRKQ